VAHEVTAAARQARYRERNRERIRQEQNARRERVRVRALYEISATPECRCCGERQTAFLVVREGWIECRNCSHALAVFGYCPHNGVRWG
jgi:hypothetical protein